MYEIDLISEDNSITITDNSHDIQLNEYISHISITGDVINDVTVKQLDNIINFTQIGVKGDKGDTGNDNLFIQDTQPITDEPKYAWFETDGGNLKTLWVETGV